jgi:P27 family predicted phage terminase small subunit
VSGGRPPKPTEQHQREGTFRKDRHNLPVVLGARGVPDLPAHLSEEATEVWNLLVADLRESGVLDKTDALAIEAVAVLVERARQARRALAEEGLFQTTARGGSMLNPAVKLERDSWSLLKQYAEQLGLTPSARARLGLMGLEGASAAQRLAKQLGENPLDQPPDQPPIDGEVTDEEED